MSKTSVVIPEEEEEEVFEEHQHHRPIIVVCQIGGPGEPCGKCPDYGNCDAKGGATQTQSSKPASKPATRRPCHSQHQGRGGAR